MKRFVLPLMLLLGSLTTLAACTDQADRSAITADDARDEAVREGGPEQDATETRREAAIPEWEERESGEVADGDR